MSPQHLTRREREVLVVLTQNGASNREIARALYLSESTIKAHMTSTMIKLGARNRTHLALIAAALLSQDAT